MKISVLLLLILSVSLRADIVIEGKVELPKTQLAPVANKRYDIVARGGVLAPYPPFAVVYLEGAFKPASELPVQQLVQKDMAFSESLLVVRVGTKIEFPNHDTTQHNVFSFSPAKRFDLGRYPANASPVPFQIFDKTGLVTLRCDIHEHMRALILVVDTPHFVKTDASGRYILRGLPGGEYVLKAWINSRTTLEHPVRLQAGEKLTVDFP